MAARRAKDNTLRRFQSECDARAYALRVLSPHFNIYEEVWAAGPPNDTSYRVDAVTKCPETGYILGWEFKRSHLFKSEFVECLQQAMHYRWATIKDARFPEIDGLRMNACIVFPDWRGLHDDGQILYEKEADEMRLLASVYRVGTFSEPRKRDGLSITLERAVYGTLGLDGPATRPVFYAEKGQEHLKENLIDKLAAYSSWSASVSAMRSAFFATLQ